MRAWLEDVQALAASCMAIRYVRCIGGPIEKGTAQGPNLKRLSHVDYLRGLAALSVLFFHATNTVENFPIAQSIRSSGQYGRYGVEVFFVISGFIIPYSMRVADYRFRTDIWQFVLKRFSRVEPAYAASIAFTLLIGGLVNALYSKTIYQWSVSELLSHAFYLTSFLGYEWINPVYWTLAIEFQFYIALAFIYGAIFDRTRRVALAILCAAVFFTAGDRAQGTVIAYIPLFTMGVMSCLALTCSVKRSILFLMILALFLAAWWKIDLVAASLGVITTVFIINGDRLPEMRALRFLGLISYSIYLFHYPIVEKLVRYGKVLGPSVGAQVIVVMLSMLVSIAVSWVAYALVERPSLRISSGIKYSH